MSAAAESHEQATGEAAVQESALCFPHVGEWYANWFRHVYARPIDGRQQMWASDWWNYPAALVRLESMWRSWEHLRLDAGTGMSVWLRDHGDPHMSVLTDPNIGPFVNAQPDDSENLARRGQPLPHKQWPEGMFEHPQS